MDCGDFGTTVSEAQKTKVTFLLRGMAALHYDAINLGEKDLQYGSEFLTEMRNDHQLPFVSANVYKYGSEELFADPYVIKEVDGTRVGIFGVVSKPTNPRMVGEKQGLEIRDPITAAQSVVAELADKCDVVIALSHLGFEKSKSFAQELPGLDFVVSGHGWNLSREPSMIGSTCVMQPGSKGKYLGQIDFEVARGDVNVVSGKAVSLNRKIADDITLAGLVKEFDAVSAGDKSGTH